MKAHPAAEIFPLLYGKEFDDLVEDIEKNGLLTPIILHPDGGILDGRNRMRACEKAGVDPRFTTWRGQGSVMSTVISLNLHRRHLTASQKAMAAAKAKPMFEAEAKKRQGTRNDIVANWPESSDELKANWPQAEKGRSRDHAAKAFDVSPRSVQRADAVIKQGTDELVEAVETGAIAVSAAAKVATTSKEVQKEIVEMSPKRRRKAVGQIAKGRGDFFSDEFMEKFTRERAWMFDFRRALEAITAMPVTPEEYAFNIPDMMKGPVDEHLDDAVNWLIKFQQEWRKNHETIDGSAKST